MMMSSIGYIAAFVSCLAFGSFAVPIKGKTANRVNIDPLVMQTYKTVMCFATSWLILLLGEKLSFTYWGFVSGLFWVPGGTAGIFAVRNAGLAVSQGLWSTLKIMVAFSWGIFIFDESVRTRFGATLAVVLMIVGLWGMSFSSSRNPSVSRGRMETENTDLEEPLLEGDQDDPLHCHEAEEVLDETDSTGSTDSPSDTTPPTMDMMSFACFKVSRRTVGLACACFDGLWGGSILVPMHYAKKSTEGLSYVISFSIGATTVLIIGWILRFAYNVVLAQSFTGAVQALPSLHIRCMWLPGSIAGLLWSLGNLSSILSVEYLGEGVGYSIVQAQMIVAGLWGVLWYKEVGGWQQICAWLTFAVVTLCGILLLSYEHQRGT